MPPTRLYLPSVSCSFYPPGWPCCLWMNPSRLIRSVMHVPFTQVSRATTMIAASIPLPGLARLLSLRRGSCYCCDRECQRFAFYEQVPSTCGEPTTLVLFLGGGCRCARTQAGRLTMNDRAPGDTSFLRYTCHRRTPTPTPLVSTWLPRPTTV